LERVPTMHTSLRASLALALPLAFLPALPAVAQTQPVAPQNAQSAEIERLRQDLAAMRSSYEARLQALEQRLHATEAKLAAAPTAASAAAGGWDAPATATATAATTAPPAEAPAVAAAPAGANGFNPAVSLILSGLYGRTSRNPSSYAIHGFGLPPNAEIGPGGRGFSLAESELGLAASVDPWFSGQANISLHPDNSVEVEEAFVQTTALGHGLTLKAGRFYSSIGYLNSQHSHTWDFVDAPLAYQAMLGTQYNDDGVQLQWLAPTDTFIALALELGRGHSFPGGDNDRNGAGMAALSAHTGGDVGLSNSWRAGLSVLHAKASGQALQGLDAAGDVIASTFSGSSRVWIADAVWKWAPGGNTTRTNFKLQGEYLRSTRDGDLTLDPTGLANTAGYRPSASGWYLQGVYQFMPDWRVGLRAERLAAGASAGVYAPSGRQPSKYSLMLDYSPSEFSRVRVQFARDLARPGAADNQFFVQYQMSLGAHGAHSY
jgi:hypothetical protein